MSQKSKPDFKFLDDEGAEAFLKSLRQRVTPILANNLLPYFTDHSVDHSDALVEIAGKLMEPIPPEHCLRDEELTILYAGCYLHDIGMQHENVGDTQTIMDLDLKQRWGSLEIETRHNIMRQHHNRISAEIVSRASASDDSPIGIRVQQEYHPDCIAALCEAHTLDVESLRYNELTKELVGVRMALLSGILRVADILDEARRRAVPAKAGSLLLDIESKVHWMRHYYTEKITFDTRQRVILLHFDFPKGKEEEYERILPHLQMPVISQELAQHAKVFNPVGLSWTVSYKAPKKAYGLAKEMPSDVLTEILKQLCRVREQEADNMKRIALQSFEEAQPSIDERLSELEKSRENQRPVQYLRALVAIARDLSQLGSKSSSWMLLAGEFMRSGAILPPEERLEVGIWLAGLLLSDNRPKEALDVFRIIDGLAASPKVIDKAASDLWLLKVRILIANCAYDESVAVITQAMEKLDKPGLQELLKTKLSELHMLWGRLREALDSASSDGDTT